MRYDIPDSIRLSEFQTDKGEFRNWRIKERLIFSALFETDAETVWKVKVVTIWLSEARSTPVDAVALAAGS